jgi:GGDEF domain-containing protein
MLENLAKVFNKSFVINYAICKVGCSVGVAIYPDEATTTSTLLAKADKNMYKTKYKLSDAE